MSERILSMLLPRCLILNEKNVLGREAGHMCQSPPVSANLLPLLSLLTMKSSLHGGPIMAGHQSMHTSHMEDTQIIHGTAIVILPGGTGKEVHKGHSRLAALTRARAGNGLIASRLATIGMIITAGMKVMPGPIDNGGTAGENHAPRPMARATSTRVRGHSLC